MKSNRKKLIVIVGPTAVGKTDVAIQLAQQLHTEIVSADSRQIFKELNIGTAKPTDEELSKVPHHLIGNKSIHEDYDAGQYGRDALELIHELLRKHDQVILCGGSGLYVKAVCEGFDDLPEIPEGVRSKIIEAYEQNGLEWLQRQLNEKDPDFFSIVDKKNPHRMIRALELIEATHQPIGILRKQKKLQHDFEIAKIGLELNRDELYHRIDYRMDKMISMGLFDEAKSFYPLKELNSLQTVGYQEIFHYLDGLYDKDEAVRLLKRNTRRYAKRQLTWFKKDKEVRWFNPSEIEKMMIYISDFKEEEKMPNKKVLIITYYWPPSGGSGVQRWLKFVKYLVPLGWEPYVYTPENPSFTIQDKSLLKDVPASVEVIRLPIWEPYEFFFKISKLFGKKEVNQSDFISTKKKSLLSKISSWIRGNFFIPDARVFWIKPSVTFLNDFIKSNEIERIITTGPPHSIHLIGLKLKKKNPSLKWIADFRDPWSEWDLLDTLSLSSWARKKHKDLERKVLKKADRVVTIAPFHVNLFERLGGRKVDLITNGFDEDDFSIVVHERTDRFTIRHVGVVDELRDPRPAMEALKQLAVIDPEFKANVSVEFIGAVNSSFKQHVANDSILNGFVVFIDSIPHSELLTLYGKTDLQLLILAYSAIAPGNLPGKFFEYLASGNPILAIGPLSGDAADVLNRTKAGEIFERSDIDGIKESLLRFYNQWKKGSNYSNGDVSAYTRRNLTDQLSRLLQDL